MIKKLIKLIYYINLRTIYLNFKFFDFRTAIRFPILINKNTKFIDLSGKIIINSEIKTGLIKIGWGDVGIFDKKNERTLLEIKGTLIFNGKANIGHGSRISCLSNAVINFGNNFGISANSTILSRKCITFGNGCLLSWDILIMDTDFHKIIDAVGNQVNADKMITFGDNVWIGCRSTILKGTTIPNGCIIAANSFVVGEYKQENSILAKNPLQVVKEEITWIP